MTSRLSPAAVTHSDPLAPSDTEEDFASASEGDESDSEEQPEASLETAPAAAAAASSPLPPAAAPLSIVTAPEPEKEQTPTTPTDAPKRSAADALSRIVSEKKEDDGAGSWGGWGSWLTSTVKSVTHEFENPNLDSILNKASSIGSNLRTVAARTVDNMYENLDPEYEQHVRQFEGRETETGDSNPNQKIDTETPKDGEDEQSELDVATEMKKTATHAAENILQTIDKTFDFASNALGTAVLGGYRKLEQVKIKERLEHLQHDVTSSEVMHVGENVMSSGLGALEALGRKAIDILNEDRPPLSAEEKGSATGKGKGEPTKATLNGFFEDNCGNAHLQAMSMLSAECSLKVTSLSSLAPTAMATLKELEKIFDTDEMLEEVEEIDQSICASEAGMREMNLLLDQMGLKASSQLRQLQAIMRNLENVLETEAEQFQKDLATAITAARSADEEDKKKVYVKDVLHSSLLNTYTNGLRSLANFAEKSCEQILRISEAFLMRIAEDKVLYNASDATQADSKSETANDTMSAKEYGTSLRKLTVQLLTETQYVSTIYIRCLAKLVETAKVKGVQDEKNVIVPLEKDQAERMDGKLAELNDHLYTDAGQAMTFVQEAMHSNLSILKLMLLQQLANERDKKASVLEKE